MGGLVTGFRIPRLAALALLTLFTTAACTARYEPASERPADLHSQLALLETPAGADPAAFEQLKSALAAIIESGPARSVSAPPSKPSAAVSDFQATMLQDSALFTWTYTNPGDYNRDGEVNISDLSVLGRFLGDNVNSPDWEQARAADGNGDGEVNISDLSTLGGNLMSTVQGYHLRSSATPGDAGSWQVLATVTLQDAALDPPSGELVFDVEIPLRELPDPNAFFQVVPFQGTQLGIASNSDTLVDAAPQISGVSPISGKSGEVVTFSADVFGSQPLTYSWDFGGAGTPNTSAAPSPVITLGAPGTYSGTLTVTNQLGSDSFQFSVTVAANQPPTVSLTAHPNAGAPPLNTTLTADANDPDGTIVKYEWDLDGNGSFETDTGAQASASTTLTAPGTVTLRVRVTDSNGATATDSVPVAVAAVPVAVISANNSQVIAPDWVSFSAAGSSSPNGAIVRYQWDWDGNGTIDLDTKADPTVRVMFDAPTGTYKPRVVVTDAIGATNSAATTVSVVSTKFVLPPVETYQNIAPPNAPAEGRWLLNSYSTLPEWRDANGPYQNAHFTEWADRVFVLLNAQRQLLGLPQYKRLRDLDLVSQAHERDQALRSYFSHDTLEGLDIGDRLFAVNPPPTLDDWGEIIAQGQESPEETVASWMNSPPHRAIIMEASLTHCGIGMYYKANGQQGLETFTGALFAGFKFQQDPPPGHDWLTPDEL